MNQDFTLPKSKKIGIGMDSCSIPLKYKNLSLLQTTDFFYPIVDNPYMMGRIALANVVSDLYAMGVTDIDSILMLLSYPSNMTNEESKAVLPYIIHGFKDAAKEAGAPVTGGETIINPWCIVGGVATSVCLPNEFIIPDSARPGDLLVLTKPLGTYLASSLINWVATDRWLKLSSVVSEEDAREALDRATNSMARLNRVAAITMHRYNARGATDVTGFGILGHAEVLARFQKLYVSIKITHLPIFKKMDLVAEAIGYKKMLSGRAPETSGGLLVILPKEEAAGFCKELESLEGRPAWVVGVVEKGDRLATIAEDVVILPQS